MILQPNTSKDESNLFVQSMRKCSKTGLHNPLKNKERYLMYGEVCRRVVEAFQDKDVWDFFVKSI